MIFLLFALSVHMQDLEDKGFTVVPDVFSPSEIEQARESFATIEQRCQFLLHTLEPCRRIFKENNLEHTSQYWKSDSELILQAGSGRYDLYQGFGRGFFGSSAVLHNPVIEQLMESLMVDDFTNYAGIILSQAGSSDQYWHRDTHTLSNTRTDGKELILLDDFYFTVLIPITVPFTIENGATEFLIGSHRLSADQFANGATVQMEVPLGSALVFNGKISHRGKANFSDRDRPALYLVYHKKWYNDQFRKGIP